MFLIFYVALIVHLLMLKLEVVRDILLESSQSEDRLDALINASIYLKVYFAISFHLILRWFFSCIA